MQHLDIRETAKSWFGLYGRFLNSKLCPLTDKPRVWSTKQKSDYLESLYYGNPTKSWFVQETRVGHWILKYGHEQFYTLLDFQNDIFQSSLANWTVSVTDQLIKIQVIRYSVSQEDVQETIRRYLSE